MVYCNNEEKVFFIHSKLQWQCKDLGHYCLSKWQNELRLSVCLDQ